jgi:hypothetical protein
MYRCGFRLERRNPGGYKIGVDKIGTARLIGQILFCKRGLPRAIWPAIITIFNSLFIPLFPRSSAAGAEGRGRL